MTDISELIERLENFCGAETLRDIEADIASAVGWSPGAAYSRYGDSANWRIDGHVETIAWPPRYASSIDAAATLVPEGWWLKLESKGEYHHAELEYVGPGEIECADLACDEVRSNNRPTPAIAICIAALKARQLAMQGDRNR
jgi:hypothetical protein